MKKQMTREQVKHMNDVAQYDFEAAQRMLDGINFVLGTQYCWLNKRVIFHENGKAHDAYANAEKGKLFCPRHNHVDGSKPEDYDKEWNEFHDKLNWIEENAVSKKFDDGDFFDTWTYVMDDGSVYVRLIQNDYMLDYSIEKIA